jgi:drug/metabolite transporter (DMT)-like permease
MILPILFIVLISISTAMVLDYIKALGYDFFNFYVLFGILFVLVLNAFKFILWNFLHQRYELSSTYPMTAIYFPLVYIISVFKGEIEVDIISILGIVFVFLGVYLIFSVDKEEVI